MKVGIGAGHIPAWTLQDRMRKARESAGLDQVQFGAQLGVSRISVSSWERGRSEPRPVILMAWAMATGVDLDWLIGETNDQRDTPQAAAPHPVTDAAAADDEQPATKELTGTNHSHLDTISPISQNRKPFGTAKPAPAKSTIQASPIFTPEQDAAGHLETSPPDSGAQQDTPTTPTSRLPMQPEVTLTEPDPTPMPVSDKKQSKTDATTDIRAHGMEIPDSVWEQTNLAAAVANVDFLKSSRQNLARNTYISIAVEAEIKYISDTYLSVKPVEPLTTAYRTGRAPGPRIASQASTKRSLRLSKDLWDRARRAQQIACAHDLAQYPTLVAFVTTALARYSAAILKTKAS